MGCRKISRVEIKSVLLSICVSSHNGHLSTASLKTCWRITTSRCLLFPYDSIWSSLRLQPKSLLLLCPGRWPLLMLSLQANSNTIGSLCVSELLETNERFCSGRLHTPRLVANMSASCRNPCPRIANAAFAFLPDCREAWERESFCLRWKLSRRGGLKAWPKFTTRSCSFHCRLL